MNDKTKPVHCSLEQYFADESATEWLSQIESDPDAAKEALLIAAGYIRRREELPGNLADYLVGAIELAMAKPQKFRAKALTDELGLTASNRRPAGNFIAIGNEVQDFLKQGKTQEDAYSFVAQKFNISEETAKRCWVKFKPIATNFDDEMEQRASTHAQGQKGEGF